MARQSGVLKLNGRLGDLSFYDSVRGPIVRHKGGPSAHQIKTSPRFQRTRENNSEFGRASKACKLIRQVFKLQFDRVADHLMTGRLNKFLRKAILADEINARGSRNIMDGNIGLLTNFEFNSQASLRNSFPVNFTSRLDRITGKMTIHIPSFNPATSLSAPSGATHFRLSSTVGEFDFANGTINSASTEGPATAITSQSLPEMDLTSILTGTTNPLVMSLGIRFFQMVDGQLIPLYNRRYNALSIVAAEGKVVVSVKAEEIEQGNSAQVKTLNPTRALKADISDELTLHYDLCGNPDLVSGPHDGIREMCFRCRPSIAFSCSR